MIILYSEIFDYEHVSCNIVIQNIHQSSKQYFASDYSNSDLSAGTPVDTKRQNYIEELIDTEEVYMADMSIVIEVIDVYLVVSTLFQ